MNRVRIDHQITKMFNFVDLPVRGWGVALLQSHFLHRTTIPPTYRPWYAVFPGVATSVSIPRSRPRSFEGLLNHTTNSQPYLSPVTCTPDVPSYCTIHPDYATHLDSSPATSGLARISARKYHLFWYKGIHAVRAKLALVQHYCRGSVFVKSIHK